MSDLHERSAVALGRAIARGELSSVEATEHFLGRIASLDPQVGAFVTLDPEGALARASAHDARRQVEGDVWANPLAGVPTAFKDLEATLGMRTAMGSVVFSDFVPQLNSPLVDRLTHAGVVSLGKTATPEFGLVCYTEPEDERPARTPWDLDRSPSGSSGGAAAAVAAGMLPWAPGSDGGGSIRTPASTCGILGLKPTRGRIGGPDALGLSTSGPLARTVEDLAAALDLMHGAYPGDLDWAAAPTTSFVARTQPVQRRLKIARYTVPMHGGTVDQSCIDAVDAATATLLSLGHEVVEIDCPFALELADRFMTVWQVGAASTPIPPEAESMLRPITQWFRAQGRLRTGPEFLQALSFVREGAKAARLATAAYDVVLTPTLARTPRRVGQLRNDADPAAESAALIDFTPFTPPYNVSGQPAMSLPLYWDDDGLPIGVQIVGAPYDELTLLQLAAELEQVVAWQDRKPPIW